MSTDELNKENSDCNQGEILEPGMEYQGVKKKIQTQKATTSTSDVNVRNIPNKSFYSSEPTLKYFYNACSDKGSFINCTGNFKLRSSLESQAVERFGNNCNVILSSQNYGPCRRISYGNILEIYDVQKETTSENVSGIYGAFPTYIVWITHGHDNGLVVFETEHDANAALQVSTNLFKSRKLRYGSDRAITRAINLTYPIDGSKQFTLFYNR
ncbi:hypothetical protein RI129_001360 [Pyrocoelia pectoralis]|uniref:Uncharacterized protein n=1 Tax=Pyrocoelia pectoralis TaxID=417401 RepID=A0AAN7ZX80_9COLE